MECDRRTFVRASAAGVAAVGSAGTGVAAAQENGSGNQSGNESGNASGGAGGQAGGGNASGGNASGGEGGEGGGEAGGSSVDTQGLLIIFGAAVMAALSPLAFAVLLLARGRDGKDGDETPSGGKRYGGGQS
jgi:hypothetical protein